MKNTAKPSEALPSQDSLRIVDGPECNPDAPLEEIETLLKLDPGEIAERAETEEYWAGRNHAMRRSGRIAA
jgi:hypothetical protein